MVLLHGGAPRGAELIAAKWADNRGVQQVVFKPDWSRHQKPAPFKRNDAMLEAMPIRVIAFPGSRITENPAAQANARPIPVRRYRAATCRPPPPPTLAAVPLARTPPTTSLPPPPPANPP